MERFFAKGLASSTQRTYKSAQKRYLQFCKNGAFTPLRSSQSILCRFVSHLANQGLKHRTIKAYLSAVRFLHIAEGREDPFISHFPRLQYTLSGIKRTECERSGQKKERLPITPQILRQIKQVWDAAASDPCCLGFFCFLRSAEMCTPSDTGYDPTVHLSLSDISVDNPKFPSILRLLIKQSKTDPFRKDISLFIGKTSNDICPVTAMLNYLLVRGSKAGPLFVLKNGRFLTRDRLVQQLRAVLSTAGMDASKYCSHRFRIGAATTAAAKGIEDSVIKTLGRWRSLAYLEYVCIPQQQLAFYSRVLCS